VNSADLRDRAAAENEVDPNRLLDGENPDSVEVEDARHWADTYRELLGVKERLLGAAQEAVAQPFEKDAAREVASTDLRALKAEHARIKRRLAFWEKRARDLKK
jgi:hypothetical protein